MRNLQIRPQLVLALLTRTSSVTAKTEMACVDRSRRFTPGHHQIKLHATEDS